MTKRLWCPACHTRTGVSDATGAPVACPECGTEMNGINMPMSAREP
ncbi:hypothetical protein [Halorubrum sp. 48-1-W]|nr:hypothetical protein [Halorubrum sp. 48-1-W]